MLGLERLADPHPARLHHPRAAQTPQELLCPLRSRAPQRVLADGHHPRRVAERPDVEMLNIIDDHSRLLLAGRAFAVTTAADVVATFYEAAPALRLPGLSAQRQRRHLHRLVPRRTVAPSQPNSPQLRHRLQTLPALPPPDLRESRTLPPDRQEIPRRQHRRRSLAELQTHLDVFAAYYNDVRPHRAKRPTPTREPRSTPASKARPTAHTDPRRRRVPHPPRPRRPDRQSDPALRRQTPPPRHRTRPPRTPRPPARPRPRRPRPHHRRRTHRRTPHRPQPDLPAPRPNVRHVLRDLSTMSRDIADLVGYDKNSEALGAVRSGRGAPGLVSHATPTISHTARSGGVGPHFCS